MNLESIALPVLITTIVSVIVGLVVQFFIIYWAVRTALSAHARQQAEDAAFAKKTGGDIIRGLRDPAR